MKHRLRLNIRGAIRFFVLLSVTVWLWWFFRSYFLFSAILLIIVGAAVSVLLFWKNKDGICAQAALVADRAGRSAAIPFDIRIENRSRFLGFGAELTYRWGNTFTQGYQTKTERLWVAPRKGACIMQRLESGYAGRIEVELTRFVVQDAFHIVEYEGCSKSGAWTVIYPGSHTEGDEISNIVEGFPADEETKKRGVEYNPDYEVREYVAGDELKSIHWKLTAKKERLMVRERLAAGREKINVLLPLGQDKDENDRLMDALWGVCTLLLEKGYPMQIFWMGRGDGLRSVYVAELGEFEGVTAEILSGSGLKQPEAAVQQMALMQPDEAYILIQTGAYEGAYVRN